MCNYFIINQLSLGNRILGYELLSDKNFEVIEMTPRMVYESIKNKNNIRGLQIAENGVDLELEKAFYMRNYMVKTHINNLKPKYENDSMCVANIMYLVIGGHEEEGKVLYDVVSSRFEKTKFNEERLKAMYEIGCISGGCKLENGKIILPVLEKKVKEPVKEPVKVEEKKPEPVKEPVKAEEKKPEPVKAEVPKMKK